MLERIPVRGAFVVSLLLALFLTAPVSAEFVRGDANGDTAIDIADPILTLAFLFSGGSVPCRSAADANNDGAVDVADPVATLAHLFSGAGPLSAPFPDCGEDPTPDALECITPPDGCAVSLLDQILDDLRADKNGTMLARSASDGWPVPVEGGRLYVSCDSALTLVAGDHDNWVGTPMNADQGFSWLVLDTEPGDLYRFTDGSGLSAADPWSRGYRYDVGGELSEVTAPAAAACTCWPQLHRFFEVTDSVVAPRTVRVFVPGPSPSRVLYVQDGEQLFDPGAPFGGWGLDTTASALPSPPLIVGIDSTASRIDEYTHVPDDFGTGIVGGGADAYADFVQFTVRILIVTHFGEPATVGVMGSSLGGLAAYHIAHRHPGEYDFAGSLSGVMGWGSIGLTNETMIERYAAAGLTTTALYLDSGGSSPGCFDGDGDGIEDDAVDADSFCVNQQLFQVLQTAGYISGTNAWYWWEPNAPSNNAAWRDRAGAVLGIFGGL